MAGFLIVIMGLFFFGIVCFGGIYLAYAYILESVYRMRTCAVPTWQAWIPFYGQYLLRKQVGMEKQGAAVAVCHMAAIPLAAWFLHDPTAIIWNILLLSLLAGFICKNIIAAAFFRTWAGERAKLYNILSMVTLGALRPIFLFAIRKKVCVFSKNT